MYFFDPTYFIFVLPAMLFAFYAQAAVSSAMARASRLPSSRGLTGREVAERIVARGGLGGVSVDSCTIRLSAQVYDRQTVAALGIAAHEAGHAVQHARGYTFLLVRNGLGLMDIGILLFFGAVVFQIITLPVEYNASARAVAALGELNLVTGEEAVEARRVLNAAALTYVAATAAALSQLLYLLTLRSRRE